MADSAAEAMVTIKSEIPVMINGGWYPFTGAMACSTICLRFQVQRVLRLISLVAFYTLLAGRISRFVVIECFGLSLLCPMAFGATTFCKTMHGILRLLNGMAGYALFLL